ncbi:energy-coupling factor transporter transmembrane component T family protein [Martelella mediterranea]|uniref:Biotin transport system permease protein n=1 Tax=Martelella mediterranea TaxID=293089 RepID=A0A4R3NUV8_9HYPH|nr:energy-coupling factor transporter transmembrane component T [Martelella mediterranea]TCT37335.1 biotin transport system permease protein [Martelella mediterranea]
MRSLYVEGDTFLHRRPASLKLIALIVFSIGLFLTESLPVLAAPFFFAAFLYARLPLPPALAVRRLLPVFAAIFLVGVFNLAFHGWHPAAITVIRLTSLMLAGAAITGSTPVADFVETVTKAVYPLERLGLLRAADIGLAVGLVIRFVPDVLNRYDAIAEAHRARGLRFRPLRVLVPLIILTLRDADSIADAIDARGIRAPVTKRKSK